MWSDVKIVYVLLKSLELVIFIYYGFILSKTKRQEEYWKKALVPILAFTIVEGLRFGRLIDYNVYYFRYESIGENFNSENYELLFKLIIYAFYNSGFSYPFFIAACSLFLIFSVFVLFQNYRQYLQYVLPLLPFCVVQSENYIRWYLAFSFVLLALYCLIQDQKRKAYLAFACAVFTHVGSALLLPILIFGNRLDKLQINPSVASVLCVITTLAMSVSDMNILVGISNFLLSIGIGNIDSRIASYLSQTELLINGEFGRSGYYAARTLSNNIRILLAFIPLIIYGKRIMRCERYGLLIYNLFVIGAILYPILSTVEIFDRYASALTFFSCIVCGVTFCVVMKNKYVYGKLVTIILGLCFFANLWPSISVIPSRENDNEMLFIWDANGRNFLPYWQWLDEKIVR